MTHEEAEMPLLSDDYDEETQAFLSDEYDEEVQAIIDGFDYEDCYACGGGLSAHVISPGLLGHAHAWCTSSDQHD